MKNMFFNKSLSRVLLTICSVGLVSAIMTLTLSYEYQSNVEPFEGYSLIEGKEYSVDELKEKINLLQRTVQMKESFYYDVVELNESGLIFLCIILTIILLIFINEQFSKKSKVINQQP